MLTIVRIDKMSKFERIEFSIRAQLDEAADEAKRLISNIYLIPPDVKQVSIEEDLFNQERIGRYYFEDGGKIVNIYIRECRFQ